MPTTNDISVVKEVLTEKLELANENKALAWLDTPAGGAEFAEMAGNGMSMNDLIDQTIWSGNLAINKFDNRDPAAEGEAAARADNLRADQQREADNLTDLDENELLTLWQLTCDALGTLPDDDELCLDHASERFCELLSVRRRLEMRIEYCQGIK